MTQHKYHFIGIGGIGMSALARILLDKNIPVSGSDLCFNANTTELIQKGAMISQGHAEHHISSNDTVIFGSQIQKSNPEYQAALALKCPLMHRSELLAHLMGEYKTFAITGTHGKTTTSSLLTSVLIMGGVDPTFAVGGMLAGLNGKLGKGSFFVAEADESDGTFLNYYPQGAIITNIGPDHLDHYKTEQALHSAFQTFFSQVKNEELLFYCGDDPILPMLSMNRGISYGFGKKNQLQISNYRQKGWHGVFDIHFKGKCYREIEVALSGEHNALNSAAVFGLSMQLSLSEEKVRSALKTFPGVSRRCEKRNEVGGVLFLDDYGHHPTEIFKTLKAVKEAIRERRLIVLFQPHRYTRTRDLLKEFGSAFEWADFLYISDIYSAFEQPIEGIDTHLLIDQVRKNSTVPCAYLPKERWSEELQSILHPHDVVLTIGAGDVYQLHTASFSPKKLTVGLVFGGLSCEHEISLRSSRFVAQSLDRTLYDVRFFGIDKKGEWIVGKEAEEILATQTEILSKNTRSLLDPLITRELEACDLFVPILHGPNGEDGTLQGLFEMLGKPYTGPDYRTCAICMDKIFTKRLVEGAGVKTPKDLTFGYHDWLEKRGHFVQQIRDTLPFPVYVKPVHLGSSVGITPVFAPEKLEEAIDLAFRHDTQVMIEEGKTGCREMEFAVLGNTHGFPVVVPAPGEKLAEGEFVDYEKKYGQNNVKTTPNPDLSPDLLEKGRELALKAYRAVGSTGMTRVDFLLDPDGEFWLFEMNSIPGLTKLSLFPKIWDREGVPADQLLNRLIILALERHRKQKRHASSK